MTTVTTVSFPRKCRGGGCGDLQLVDQGAGRVARYAADALGDCDAGTAPGSGPWNGLPWAAEDVGKIAMGLWAYGSMMDYD